MLPRPTRLKQGPNKAHAQKVNVGYVCVIYEPSVSQPLTLFPFDVLPCNLIGHSSCSLFPLSLYIYIYIFLRRQFSTRQGLFFLFLLFSSSPPLPFTLFNLFFLFLLHSI
ncbi:MAG: hypothetical protein JOS17DRAFT_33795 [Linnemannia elongata]|nr:MAG: hypothetical protein JOS17DRAFT_33795 [Linnemannia elongata]